MRMGLGKLFQMVPIHLGFLRSRVGSAQAKVQIPNETFTWIMMFIDSKSFLAEKNILNIKALAYIFYYRVL